MKTLEPAQIPAQGILMASDFGDSKYYRIACRCGNNQDDIDLNIEVEDGEVNIHIWSTTKTDWWTRRFDDHDNFIVHWTLERLNDWLNRFSVAWTALSKGYIETQSWTLMNKQQAYNVANTLVRAIKDVEDFEEKRARSISLPDSNES